MGDSSTTAGPIHTDGASRGSAIELRIPASPEWVRVARLTVAGVASRMQFGIEEIEDIKLAVAEAINNAIQHAPVPEGATEPPTVTITVQASKEGLSIQVTDEGRIADGLPERQSSAPLDEADLPEGGLGLILIRTLMDDVVHVTGQHADTSVRMFKRLPARVALGAAEVRHKDGQAKDGQAKDGRHSAMGAVEPGDSARA